MPIPSSFQYLHDNNCCVSLDSGVKKRCFDHLGCTVELPTFLGPNYPEKLTTTFKMFNRDMQNTQPTKATYDPIEYCIKNTSIVS